MSLDKKNINHKWNIPIIVVIVFFLMTCFEIFQQILIPDISIMQSHVLTIFIFTLIIACVLIYIKKRMIKTDQNFQEKVWKWTSKLEEMNKSLKAQVQENILGETINRANRKDWEKTFDAIDDWIAIIDLNSTILRSNRTVEKYFQLRVQESIGIKCCKLVHGTDSPVDLCPLPKMLKTKKRERSEIKAKDGRWMLITVDPIFNSDGKMISAVHIVRDISKRILIWDEREKLVKDMEKALSRIKTLSGLLPICSNCKKIRDDKGYWNRIESYIETHSDASFSHGMCPECSDKLYGNEDWYIDMKKGKEKE